MNSTSPFVALTLAEVVQTGRKASADDGISPLGKAFALGRIVRLRARGIPERPAPMLPAEGFDYWCERILARSMNHYDAVIIMTGETGSGKSTGVLRMAQKMDPTFTLEKRLCYSPAQIIAAYENIEVGQVVLFDEGVRGLLAGDQSTTEQKALVQALALVREKGAILFICAPNIWNVAKQIRQHRSSLWIHVMGRGLALVHERDARLRYIPDQTLGFRRSEVCPYLEWRKYPETSRFWLAYLAVKHARLQEYLKETKELLEGKGRRKADGGREAQAKASSAPAEPAAPADTAEARIAARRAAAAARSKRYYEAHKGAVKARRKVMRTGGESHASVSPA